MRISDLVYKLAFVGMAAVVLISCKKENGIDNNQVIKKPYGLYIGDSEGAIMNTNDGNLYRTIHPTDGYAPRAIVTSGNNVMFVKANLHVSEDNGMNFNPKYLLGINPLAQWQPLILTVKDQGRVYLSSMDPTSKGVVYSENNGVTWSIDYAWDENVMGGGVSSFTQLRNGALFAFNGDTLFQRDNKTDPWSIVPMVNKPDGTNYLGHFNNTLLLTDYTGVNGVSWSNDSGKNWTAYTGLPKTILHATMAPFEQVLLVGTDSMGIYRLQQGQFVPSNNGLETSTSVFAIAGKDEIFKNDAIKRYVYIATDKGLYRSEDLGQNWTLVKEGSYKAVY